MECGWDFGWPRPIVFPRRAKSCDAAGLSQPCGNAGAMPQAVPCFPPTGEFHEARHCRGVEARGQEPEAPGKRRRQRQNDMRRAETVLDWFSNPSLSSSCSSLSLDAGISRCFVRPGEIRRRATTQSFCLADRSPDFASERPRTRGEVCSPLLHTEENGPKGCENCFTNLGGLVGDACSERFHIVAVFVLSAFSTPCGADSLRSDPPSRRGPTRLHFLQRRIARNLAEGRAVPQGG
jgi:hypothetical protein